MFNKDFLHHAYIVEGNREDVFPKICEFCDKDLKFSTKANPDFLYEEFDRFSVDDARRFGEMQLRKTTSSGRKIFIIAFNFITREAQNSLLKVLEEPTPGTHFFIITPTSQIFLETVLSRVITVSMNGGESRSLVDAQEFLKQSPAKKIEYVAKLVKSIKDEKESKAFVISFVKDLQTEIHKDFENKKYDRAEIIEELQKVESYLHDTSSSVKNLLEHTALLVS